MKETLADLGEIELLNRIKNFMDIGQIDDDTSLITPSNKSLLINKDILVENVHFSEQTTSAEDIGWKAITSNISDLASSGVGEIISISVGLVAPPSTSWEWVEGVYKGMEQALNKYGGKLTGGDCSKGKEKLLSITAIGSLGKFRMHRSNAIDGDLLITSGPHGLSRLGLALLMSEDINYLDQLPSNLKFQAIKAHRRPNAPIDALRKLEKCKPKELKGRAAATDSSDGLLEAIHGICRSSKCQAILNKNNLPKINNWPKGEKWDNWCLQGGEDYQLVISLSEIWANEFMKIVPSAYKIGKIQKGIPKVFWDNGMEINNETNPKNFSHF